MHSFPPRALSIPQPNQARRWTRWIGQNWARINYARRVEPTWLELNRWELPIAGLAAPMAGFRIVQLSDLHCSRGVTAGYIREAVELAQSEKGDVVVLTGDFIHKGFRYVNRVARDLKGLTAPHGVFAVLGNHDHSIRNSLGIRRHRDLHRAVEDALSAQGVRVLRNETVTLRRDDAALHLAGVDDLWSRACDVDQALHGLDAMTPRVMLAHNPRTIEKLKGHRCDLMLSGHTHGGQVNWPGLGRVTLGRRSRQFAAGLYRYQQTHLYVNKGVGFGVRFRFGVRPEVASFNLIAANSK